MRSFRKFLNCAIVIGLALAWLQPAMAQNGLGTITGEVTDSSGAVIVGARVVATNVATGVQKSVVTTDTGTYFIPNLIPGSYNLKASAQGFKTVVHQAITLQVEDRLSIKLVLAVGATSETVEVTSTESGLRTQDAQTGEVISHNLIEEMPDLNRDPFGLIKLAGNVQGDGSRAGINLGLGSSIYSGASSTAINGGRTQGVEYLVDGMPVAMGFVHNVANATPAMDDVSEFKVITNGLSAEYGRLSGGAVSVSTMSGTNHFHGQLFEYNQNAFLNANSWYNDAQKAPKGNFRQNDFGFAIGGPVILPHLYDGRNKTFWYASYEGVRNSSAGSVSLGQTITDQERTGDLTDIGTGPCVFAPDGWNNGDPANCPSSPWAQVYDPYQNSYPNQVLDPTTGNMTYQKALAGGDGRHIPAGELNPLVQAYIKLMPHPNHAPVGGTGTAGNYLARQANSLKQNNWSVRIDQNISNASSIYARFNYSTGNTYLGPYNPVLGTYSGTNIDGGFNALLHFSHTFSPSTVLDLHVGGIYNPWDTGSHLPSSFSNSGMGFSSDVESMIGDNNIVNFKTGPMTEGQPIGGLVSGGQYNALLQSAQFYNVNSASFDYAGSLTKILGRHSLKFGYEGRRYYDDPLSSAQSNASNPGDGYGFDASAVATPYVDLAASDDTWFNQGYADGVGQFLMGIDSWTRITGATGRALAENYYASYLQDDFKVNSKLTLNLGIRWEMESPVTERHNNMMVWDPNAPSPFAAQGYNWNAALASAGLDPSQVQTPSWVTNGFPNGNLVFVGTPQHPSRLASYYHPWNFSPRLGAAYSITPRTVLSGSFGILYLPTSGNLTTYGDSPGVAYASSLNNQNTQVCCNVSIPQLGMQTISAPFNSSQLFPFQHNTLVADQQATQSGTGTGGMDVYMHMPHEFDWGLNVQHQFQHDWLVELSYSANESNTLLSVGNPSRFPANLHTGGPNGTNAKTYSTPVAAPFGSFCPQGGCAISGTMNVAYLEYAYPYYGPLTIEGENIGTSHYESGNLRIQHRYKSGLYVLFNYTLSKLLDNTGGPDTTIGNPGSGTGTEGKNFQQVYDINSIYGLSSSDETHVAGLSYVYNLPFGIGRRFMFGADGLTNRILQGVAGGWNVAGSVNWNSGTPITINANGENVDQGSAYDFVTFPSFASGAGVRDLFNKNFHGPSTVIVPPGVAAKSQGISAFNLSALANGGQVESFTNGNVPQDIGTFRNPGDWNSNISVMKNFTFSSDASRYFQVRLESDNFLNHPGYGGYDSNTGDSTFGQITGTANGSRAVQISGRVVF